MRLIPYIVAKDGCHKNAVGLYLRETNQGEKHYVSCYITDGKQTRLLFYLGEDGLVLSTYLVDGAESFPVDLGDVKVAVS